MKYFRFMYLSLVEKSWYKLTVWIGDRNTVTLLQMGFSLALPKSSLRTDLEMCI